jgi:membrane dipeptidase
VTTNAAGYWEFDLATSIEASGYFPLSFRVSEPYPNPFNPNTRLEFSIPYHSPVRVTVYNILGEVVDFRESSLTAGAYSINWEGRGAAGTYFINVRTMSGSVTKKVTQLDGLNGGGLSGFSPGADFIRQTAKPAAAIPVRIVIDKFGYVADSRVADIQGGEYFETYLPTIHSQCDLFDLHNDVLEQIYYSTPGYHLKDYHTYNHTDIPRLKLGGVNYQFFVAWVSPNDPAYFDAAMTMISKFKLEVSLNPDDLVQVKTASEALTIRTEGKIAGILCVEGGHIIENDLNKLDQLYKQGMRYLTITWNNSTDWAVSAQDARSATVGLSDFGREVIRRLDSLGVIIDVSHVGIKTVADILATSENPIIASHSGARALHDHYRNLTDDQIIGIANSGGVIGVVFYYPFLSGSSRDIKQVVDHIDYIKNLVGIDHVALGSDFDGISSMITGLEDVSKFPNVTLELLKKGYSRSDIEKILSGNAMRVFQAVCE